MVLPGVGGQSVAAATIGNRVVNSAASAIHIVAGGSVDESSGFVIDLSLVDNAYENNPVVANLSFNSDEGEGYASNSTIKLIDQDGAISQAEVAAADLGPTENSNRLIVESTSLSIPASLPITGSIKTDFPGLWLILIGCALLIGAGWLVRRNRRQT